MSAAMFVALAARHIVTTATRSTWAQDEDRVLHALFPCEGAKGVGRVLTHRSIGAIYDRARVLSVRSRHGGGRKPRHG